MMPLSDFDAIIIKGTFFWDFDTGRQRSRVSWFKVMPRQIVCEIISS
jgi:hypothetical protein